MEIIQEIRSRYDPLYEHVAPHITLVFPFTSDIRRNEIENHLRNTIGKLQSFKLTLQGISKQEGNYLFLNVIEGAEQLIELHKRLYTDVLSDFYPEYFLCSTSPT